MRRRQVAHRRADAAVGHHEVFINVGLWVLWVLVGSAALAARQDDNASSSGGTGGRSTNLATGGTVTTVGRRCCRLFRQVTDRGCRWRNRGRGRRLECINGKWFAVHCDPVYPN